MKHILVAFFLIVGFFASAQVVADSTYMDGIAMESVAQEEPTIDTTARALQRSLLERDSLSRLLASLHSQLTTCEQRLERISRLRDSLVVNNERFQKELQEKNAMLEEQIHAIRQKDTLVAELQQLYRDALTSSTVNKATLEADIAAKQASIDAKNHEIEFMQRGINDKENSIADQKAAYERLALEKERYRHLVDSLRTKCVEADKELVRKQEENKYLAQRAKEAEEKVNTATNRKKKVRPIQGIAMRFYRTPEWTISLTPNTDGDGYVKQIWNRNAGNMEFDFVTGASVMLWDLTPIFNKTDSSRTILTDIRSFDQQFSYDLGLHVAFGGSNLFKNFYVGPSFRFMDFFYLTAGVNVCEYEVLKEGISNYDILDASQNMTDIICKKWLVKPFISFSIDLDFLSYIKK